RVCCRDATCRVKSEGFGRSLDSNAALARLDATFHRLAWEKSPPRFLYRARYRMSECLHTMTSAYPPPAQGLYDPAHEHDACGLGFIAHIKGRKTHEIIAQGLSILKNLTHRGATGADPLQGDGAGILVQLPDAFFRRACGKLSITLPAIGQYGVGMVFLPQEPASRMACEQEIERAISAEGQVLLGWRDVP